jgi:polyisoprenoid-binding protein YceI
MFKQWLAIAGIMLSAAVSYGQTATVHLDPEKTQVQWTLPDPLHTVKGTFHMREGNVSYDLKSGVATGSIIVDAASGQSGNSSRDSKMQKEELESTRYPDVIFRPQHVEGTLNPSASSTLAVSGIFSLHGSDHPLTMNITVQPQQDGVVTAKTEFQVPYVQWGIKDPSMFLLRVGKEVKIEITANGTLALK